MNTRLLAEAWIQWVSWGPATGAFFWVTGLLWLMHDTRREITESGDDCRHRKRRRLIRETEIPPGVTAGLLPGTVHVPAGMYVCGDCGRLHDKRPGPYPASPMDLAWGPGFPARATPAGTWSATAAGASATAAAPDGTVN